MKFVVHSRHDTSVGATVDYPGVGPVVAQLPVAIIELVPADGVGPSIVLRRSIANAEQKEGVDAIFNTGAVIAMGEWALVTAAPAPTEAK